MPSQGNELIILRRRTSDTEDSLPDEDAEILFDEAETEHPNYSRTLILQAVIVARLEELVVAASKAVTYQLNEARFNRSDTMDMLEKMLKKHQAKLDQLLKDEKPVAAAMGVIRRVPTQWKDTP
jgi:arginine deiminase